MDRLKKIKEIYKDWEKEPQNVGFRMILKDIDFLFSEVERLQEENEELDNENSQLMLDVVCDNERKVLIKTLQKENELLKNVAEAAENFMRWYPKKDIINSVQVDDYEELEHLLAALKERKV